MKKTPLELQKRINNLRMALEIYEDGGSHGKREHGKREYAFYDRGANVIDHFLLTDYTESFEDNLAQIEKEDVDVVQPLESFLRLSRSVENMQLKFMQEGLSLHFSDEDKVRLYATTAGLFKRLNSDDLKLDRYHALCMAMPELAMICTDYPETLDMQKMQEFNYREPSFFQTIRAQVEMPHLSKAGKHLIYIAKEDDAAEEKPLMLAENRDGKTHCWTPHYIGTRDQILMRQKEDAEKVVQHYGRHTPVFRDFTQNSQAVLSFMDQADKIFKNIQTPSGTYCNPI